MANLKRTLIPLALATVVALPVAATIAQQQQPPPPQHQFAPRNLPTPETMQRMLEGRIAMMKTALKLTDAQLKLWGPVEEVMRANHAARERLMRERFERARATPQSPPTPPSLEQRLDLMAQRADRVKAFVAAVKPLYASLSDEQKAVAGTLMRGFFAMQRERGERGMRGHHRFQGRFHGPQPQ